MCWNLVIEPSLRPAPQMIDDISDLAELGDALVLKLDVTDRTQAEAAVKAALDHFDCIDVRVNNVGLGRRTSDSMSDSHSHIDRDATSK